MKKRIVRLTESDLRRIVKRVIREDMGGMDDVHPTYGNVNFNELTRDQILNLGKDNDDDEYYGTFDDTYMVDKNDRPGKFDYSDFEEEEFSDFDSYRKSKYGRDPKNKWDLNSPDEDQGRRFFNAYQEKSGGRPFKVRRRR
jgi:hypothetical protein